MNIHTLLSSSDVINIIVITTGTTSNSEVQRPNTGGISSDDECLSSLLQRSTDVSIETNKELMSDGECDVDEILTEDLVRVEEDGVDANLYLCDDNLSLDLLAPIPEKKIKKRRKRIYRCPSCDAVFDVSLDLKTHSLTHQVKTRHKCEQCNRYFKRASGLKLHKRVHFDKIEKCLLCDKTFSLKIDLRNHMMTHERTVMCDQCPAKFYTKEQLDEHTRASEELMVDEDVMLQTLLENANQIETEFGTTQSDRNTDHDAVKNNNLYNKDAEKKVVIPLLFNPENGFLKREDLSHATQCSIVSKMQKGRSIADICRLYNLTPEIVNEIWEERDKYHPKKVRKGSNKYLNSILDTKIVEWFNRQKSNGIQVSGKMLQDIAEAFAKEVGFVGFNGSKKWLERFKKRYNISLRGTPSKRDFKNITIESKWKKFFFEEQWLDIRLGIANEDIYTADEVGVYYNSSKGRIRKLASKKFIQGYAKDRLAIFMCTNATGTDKKKLLVCGTEDPLIHSYREPSTLPVKYIRHNQAHFTTKMFEQYVKSWNRQLKLVNKKALLILDRASIHSKLKLSHLELVFVPWKASRGLIPIKNGIFATFRNQYRRLILEEKAMNVLRGVDRNLTCLEALSLLEKAWERTPAHVIANSFESTGYDVEKSEVIPSDVPKKTENDEEVICNMLKDFDVDSYFTDLPSLDMYLTVDEELVTGKGTNGSVFGGNHKANDSLKYRKREKDEILPVSTEKPDSDEKEKTIRKCRALEDLEIVRKYLQSNNTSYSLYCNFMEVENFLMKLPLGYSLEENY